MDMAHGPNHGSNAVGILRVSQVAGRPIERFHSPEIQRDAIVNHCDRIGLNLIEVYDESRSVSGGLELEDRPGLSEAMKRVESGSVRVIVVSTLDRAFRNLDVQRQVLRRIRDAGGELHAIDEGGPVKIETAAQRFGVDIKGLVAEYHREVSREKSAEGQERAIARGAWAVSRVPYGYVRREDGTLAVDPDESKVKTVREAFELRASGATIPAIRKFLFERGVDRTNSGVIQMLRQRVYLGEIHWGKHVNANACDPIIERDLFDRVQRMTVPRGRHPKSERLLSRLKVLRCDSCGGALTIDTGNGKHSPIYKCTNDRRNRKCPQSVAITADIADRAIVEVVRAALADASGRAGAAEGARNAAQKLQDAQSALDSAIRRLTQLDLLDEPAALEEVTRLRTERNDAQAQVDQIPAETTVSINAAEDWDSLSLDGQRQLVRAVVAEARVVPLPKGGRRRWDGGARRLRIRLVGRDDFLTPAAP